MKWMRAKPAYHISNLTFCSGRVFVRKAAPMVDSCAGFIASITLCLQILTSQCSLLKLIIRAFARTAEAEIELAFRHLSHNTAMMFNIPLRLLLQDVRVLQLKHSDLGLSHLIVKELAFYKAEDYTRFARTHVP